jgi:hypothetical protein
VLCWAGPEFSAAGALPLLTKVQNFHRVDHFQFESQVDFRF